METREINFSGMPQMFGRCIKEECAMAETCLRRLAMLHGERRGDWLSIVNPETTPADATCPHYVDAYRPAYGCGMQLNIGQVPYDQVRALRRDLAAAYSRMTLSRMQRGITYVSPEEQTRLAQLCEKHGAPAPTYAEMTHPWRLE